MASSPSSSSPSSPSGSQITIGKDRGTNNNNNSNLTKSAVVVAASPTAGRRRRVALVVGASSHLGKCLYPLLRQEGWWVRALLLEGLVVVEEEEEEDKEEAQAAAEEEEEKVAEQEQEEEEGTVVDGELRKRAIQASAADEAESARKAEGEGGEEETAAGTRKGGKSRVYWDEVQLWEGKKSGNEKLWEEVEVVVSCMAESKTAGKLATQLWEEEHQMNVTVLEECSRRKVRQFVYHTLLGGPVFTDKLPRIEARERLIDRLSRNSTTNSSGASAAEDKQSESTSTEHNTQCTWTIIRSNLVFKDFDEVFRLAAQNKAFDFGSGEKQMNPIHGEDLAAFVVEVVKAPDRFKNLCVSVGGPQLLTWKEIVTMAHEAAANTSNLSWTKIPGWIVDVGASLSALFTPTKAEKWRFLSLRLHLFKDKDGMVAETLYGRQELMQYFKRLAERKKKEKKPNGDKSPSDSLVGRGGGRGSDVIADDVALHLLQQSWTRTIVSAGGRYEHAVHVEEGQPNDIYLQWEFATAHRDISFGIMHQPHDGAELPTSFLAMERVDSHLGIVRGEKKVKKAGSYLLVWDNSYSILRKKELSYRVAIGRLNPSDAEERISKENAQKEETEASGNDDEATTIVERQPCTSSRSRTRTDFVETAGSSRRRANGLTKPVVQREEPLPEIIAHGTVGKHALASGYAYSQGRRPTMEDAHVCIDDLQRVFPDVEALSRFSACAYYAVYDGHGGRRAAEVASALLHGAIVKDPAFQTNDVEAALRSGFASTDKSILQTGLEEKWKDGATAVVAMILNRTLYVANVGDAEAVLAARHVLKTDSGSPSPSSYDAICLTTKHKCNEESEKQRIVELGGSVVFGRLFGTLAVSRAFGDADFKKSKDHDVDFVIPDPYIHPTILLRAEEEAQKNEAESQQQEEKEENENEGEANVVHEFLIIACDGLWDGLSYKEAVDLTARLKNEQGKSPKECSFALVEAALERGSSDNITAIVVFLDELLNSS